MVACRPLSVSLLMAVAFAFDRKSFGFNTYVAGASIFLQDADQKVIKSGWLCCMQRLLVYWCATNHKETAETANKPQTNDTIKSSDKTSGDDACDTSK